MYLFDGSLKQSKRHAEILRLVAAEGTVSIAGLAERFGVSLETIRRDVQPLAETGAVVKLHGAVTRPQAMAEAPFATRLRENAEAKRAIARRFAALVSDGDSLMLDHGSTACLLAHALADKRRLTVVTNSAEIARTLATINDNTVHMAGGELRRDDGAALGSAALAFLARFRVRHSVITTSAVDAVAGPMVFDVQEAEICRVMAEAGETRSLLADHRKFGRRALVSIAQFDLFDQLVTDRPPPPEVASALAAAGVDILLPAP